MISFGKRLGLWVDSIPRKVLYFLMAPLWLAAFAATFYVAGLQGKDLPSFEWPRNPFPMGAATLLFEINKFSSYGPAGNKAFIYYLFEPKEEANQSKYPLVVVLHGGSGKAYAAKYLSSDDVQRKYPAYVLVPVLTPKTTWSTPQKPTKFERLPYVVSLVKELTDTHAIDTNRIYVIGCSEGGFGAFGAARYYNGLFAASVAISGGWVATDADYLTDMPLLVFHGAKDTIIPVKHSRNVSRLIEAKGGDIKYTEDQNGWHNCPWEGFYNNETWDWMFSKSK